MHKNPLVVAALAFFLISVATGSFSAPPNPNQASRVSAAPPMAPAASILKPDLIVEKIWVTATHPEPGGATRVDVQYTVFNNSGIDSWKSPTAAGTLFWFDHHDQPNLVQKFYSSLDMRELPNGVFPPPQPGQGCLASLAANSRFDCVGAVVVPTGKMVEIRATADSLNYIDEINESNNSKPIVWQAVVAKPPLHR